MWTVVAGEGDRLQTGYEPVGGTVGMELYEGDPPVERHFASAAAGTSQILMIHLTGEQPLV